MTISILRVTATFVARRTVRPSILCARVAGQPVWLPRKLFCDARCFLQEAVKTCACGDGGVRGLRRARLAAALLIFHCGVVSKVHVHLAAALLIFLYGMVPNRTCPLSDA
eukprot:44262-Chlamydomonas_euryale.AAC.6